MGRSSGQRKSDRITPSSKKISVKSNIDTYASSSLSSKSSRSKSSAERKGRRDGGELQLRKIHQDTSRSISDHNNSGRKSIVTLPAHSDTGSEDSASDSDENSENGSGIVIEEFCVNNDDNNIDQPVNVVAKVVNSTMVGESSAKIMFALAVRKCIFPRQKFVSEEEIKFFDPTIRRCVSWLIKEYCAIPDNHYAEWWKKHCYLVNDQMRKKRNLIRN